MYLFSYFFQLNGDTPLHLASFNGYVETAAMLIRYGANIDIQNNVRIANLSEDSSPISSTCVFLLFNIEFRVITLLYIWHVRFKENQKQ